jgi:hypothetical protein
VWKSLLYANSTIYKTNSPLHAKINLFQPCIALWQWCMYAFQLVICCNFLCQYNDLRVKIWPNLVLTDRFKIPSSQTIYCYFWITIGYQMYKTRRFKIPFPGWYRLKWICGLKRCYLSIQYCLLICSHHLVAVGDTHGKVVVWQQPSYREDK